MFIDERHVTIPQVGGMYKGDRARKENLVNYGFRLPSALDNRPLRFDEFERLLPQTMFVSATPADYEQTHAGQVVEQVVRPTGLVDPALEVRPAQTQVDDLLSEINLRAERHERVLVTTLTKRMAEDLTDYLNEHGVKVRYLHSDIDTVERVEIIRDLRLGEFDVLVGINLLREGLDIPEVSLVAILDADKEGFLRAERSLIQTIGRAARHINGMAILYADTMTDSMKAAIGETTRRRNKQIAWNEKMGITPIGVQKRIKDLIDGVYDADEGRKKLRAAQTRAKYESMPEKDMEKELKHLERDMLDAAKNLEFEKAAQLRDRLARAQGSDVRRGAARETADADRTRAVRPTKPIDATGRRRWRAIAVLFVCLGNICRSPTAEGVFRAALRSRGGLADKVRIDSAGLGDWHVGCAAGQARASRPRVARGYDLSDAARRARSERTISRAFDWILAWTNCQPARARRDEARRNSRATSGCCSTLRPSTGVREVPDPYYGGPEGFDRVLDLIEASAAGLVARLHPMVERDCANPARGASHSRGRQ